MAVTDVDMMPAVTFKARVLFWTISAQVSFLQANILISSILSQDFPSSSHISHCLALIEATRLSTIGTVG